MTLPGNCGRSAPWEGLCPYLGFMLVVLGMKLALIAHFANATPFWDQWDAEAYFLYRPWLEGTLTFTDLFHAHNEHRLLVTRLWNLALLELNGRLWDPLLQMQVNAGLHVLALGVVLYGLNRGLAKGTRGVLLLWGALLLSIPFGWENTLAGFQSQFYFLLLFSFMFLWQMSHAAPYTLAWWIGYGCGVLSVLSLASGMFTVVAGLLLLALRALRGEERGQLPIVGLLLLALVAGMSIALTPYIPYHDPFKAHSLWQFLKALAKAMGWPSAKMGGILVIQAPLLLFMWRLLRGTHERSASTWFVFAVGLWSVGQCAILAYGRATDSAASRYQDLLVIGLLVNFACLGRCFGAASARGHKRYRYATAAWLVLVALGFASASGTMADALRAKARQGAEQEKHVRAYLVTGDVSHLLNKPLQSVPYPDPHRLQALLDNPTIRRILPGNLVEANATAPPTVLKRAVSLVSSLRAHLIALGVAFFVLWALVTEATAVPAGPPSPIQQRKIP